MDIKAASALSQKLMTEQSAAKRAAEGEDASVDTPESDTPEAGSDSVRVDVSDKAEMAAKLAESNLLPPKGLADLDGESARLAALDVNQRIQLDSAPLAGNAEQAILALLAED